MPIIDGYECRGYVAQPDGSLKSIEDDMTDRERDAFWESTRNRLANAMLQIMYEKEVRRMSGDNN